MSVRPSVAGRDRPDDVDALVERVATLERTQLTEDVEGFVDLFDADAVWVTGGGRRLIGRDAIASFTCEVLPGWTADGSSASYRVEHVVFIADDVALTCVVQTYVDADGQPTGGGLPSYVWRRRDGVWRIIAGQNTAVDQPR